MSSQGKSKSGSQKGDFFDWGDQVHGCVRGQVRVG